MTDSENNEKATIAQEDKELNINDFSAYEEPFTLFHSWYEKAKQSEINDPNAMALATVDKDGLPNVRMVLLKDFSEQGFVFYTNYESAKGKEILQSSKAAICFHWKSLRRQIRIRGNVEQVSKEEADTYFASRPLGSRIGAWASQQSRELESRYALEKAVAKYTAQYALGNIPRPEYWSGFIIKPLEIEFWQDRKFRLHDRILYRRGAKDETWETQRLYP